MPKIRSVYTLADEINEPKAKKLFDTRASTAICRTRDDRRFLSCPENLHKRDVLPSSWNAICRIRDCWQFALYLIRCVYKWNVLNESFLEYIYIYITFRYKCKNWKHSMRISRNFKYIFLMTQERVNWNKFRSEIKVEISRFFRNEERNWEFFFTGLIVVIHRSIGTASRRDFSSYFLLSFSPFSTLRIGELTRTVPAAKLRGRGVLFKVR